MSKHTKFNYKGMSQELYEQCRMFQPVWMQNVKCCFNCNNYDNVVGYCDKLSDITGCFEEVIWFVSCEYYDGHAVIDNAYGYYEIVKDDEEKEE